ncbi:GDYXXLXY domain-containing protein [uncultured Roseibium sp.]|uniref:GDYXXLXY domain-containing protein n=1 Tax=uncultured Roseibium sp. TaxID=1936171 RepID=UPI0032170F02
MSLPNALRSPFLRWGLVALIQLALIAVPLADRLQVQMSGQEVVLNLRPVDPRDLLRGDYVILNLEIGRVPVSLQMQGEIFGEGDTVFAGLEITDDGSAKVVRLTRTRKDAGPLAIKGTDTGFSDGRVTVDYGIDAFYLPEGEGKEIERLPAKRVQVVVAIHPDGRALPLRLLVDGKTFKSDEVF